jgi:hypothetical protein
MPGSILITGSTLRLAEGRMCRSRHSGKIQIRG